MGRPSSTETSKQGADSSSAASLSSAVVGCHHSTRAVAVAADPPAPDSSSPASPWSSGASGCRFVEWRLELAPTGVAPTRVPRTAFRNRRAPAPPPGRLCQRAASNSGWRTAAALVAGSSSRTQALNGVRVASGLKPIPDSIGASSCNRPRARAGLRLVPVRQVWGRNIAGNCKGQAHQAAHGGEQLV